LVETTTFANNAKLHPLDRYSHHEEQYLNKFKRYNLDEL